MISSYSSLNTCLFGDKSTTCTDNGQNFIDGLRADRNLEVLFLVDICVLILTKYLFAYYIIKKFESIEGNRISPSKYTIMLKVPKKLMNSGEELETIVGRLINRRKKRNEPGIKFLKFNPIYDIKEYVSITKKMLLNEKQLKIATLKNEKKLIKHLTVEKNQFKEKFLKVSESFKAEIAQKFTGWVSVTFSDIKSAEIVQKNNQNIRNYFFFWKKIYNYREAPEPNDIIWENWVHPYRERSFRRLIGGVVSFALISANFGIVLLIKWGQTKIGSGDGTSQVGLFFVSIAISASIALINIIVRFILYKFSKYESYRTFSAYHSVIVFKVTWANFINTALVILIANRVAQSNDSWNIFGSVGTMGNMIILLIINTIADTLVFLFDPLYLMKVYQRYVIKKRMSQSKNTVLQCEANEAWEGSTIDIAELYYISFKTISISFFYQLIIPYGLILGVVELFLKYWIFKFIIVRRSARPISYLSEFSINMIKNFEFMIFILALGFFVFKIILVDWGIFKSPIMIAILVITCYEFFVGIKLFKSYSDYRQFSKNPFKDISFTENEINFYCDYDRMNPVTQKQAYENWVKQLEKLKMGKFETTPVEPSKKLQPFQIIEGINDYAIRRNNDMNAHERVYQPDVPLFALENAMIFDQENRNQKYNNVPVYQIQDMAQTFIMNKFNKNANIGQIKNHQNGLYPDIRTADNQSLGLPYASKFDENAQKNYVRSLINFVKPANNTNFTPEMVGLEPIHFEYPNLETNPNLPPNFNIQQMNNQVQRVSEQQNLNLYDVNQQNRFKPDIPLPRTRDRSPK